MISEFKENYKGPLIQAVIMGGGYSGLLGILSEPGASKFIHSIDCLYSICSIQHYLRLRDVSDYGIEIKCNPQTTNILYQTTNEINKTFGSTMLEPPQILIVNAALTTDRYRQGDNRAYIQISPNEYYYVEIDKVSKIWHDGLYLERRQQEDIALSEIVFDLLSDKNLTEYQNILKVEKCQVK